MFEIFIIHIFARKLQINNCNIQTILLQMMKPQKQYKINNYQLLTPRFNDWIIRTKQRQPK